MSELADLRSRLEEAGAPTVYVEQLAAYGARLLDANRNVNLTGAKTPGELLPHLIDSLTIAPEIAGRYVDVGSGGGLPAIPLVIVSGAEVTLVESIAKKAAFLRAIIAELGLAAQVVAERAELAGRDPELREAFDVATARAVSSAPTVAELLVPFLRVGGKAVLQRGTLEPRERDALTDAALMLGARVFEERPLEGGRRIIVLLKEHPTGDRFPRRPGIPEKRPLCL